MGLEAAVGEDAGVHPRVQRLDPAVEALGEAGEVLDLGDRQAEARDQRRRAAGGDQLDAGVVQAADEVLEPGLVVDGDQGPLDRDAVGRTRRLLLGRAVGMSGAPRRSMLPASLPGGRPPAPVVWPQPRGSEPAEPDRAALDHEALAGHPADRVDEHRALGDLDPLVQGLDGVVVRDRDRRWATIGPVSTPASTTKSVQPVTFTPYASASAGPCIPGNDGDSAGWVLTTLPPNSAEEGRCRPAS